jgi:DNA-binding GntR family transcriptional regulator
MARGQSRKQGRPEQVFRRLRTQIVRGHLAPGTRIIETEVAERLGVSRTPVRGALQRLEQEGYIVGSPALRQTRLTVSPLTRHDAHELFSIIAEVEGLAARLAAMLVSSRREPLAATLAGVNAQLRKAAEARRPDHNILWELDELFHRSYVRAGAGPRLRALNDAIKPQAERYERLYVSLLGKEMTSSIAEHDAIVHAIRTGDPDHAQRAVQLNWRNAAQRLGAVIDRVGESGQRSFAG